MGEAADRAGDQIVPAPVGVGAVGAEAGDGGEDDGRVEGLKLLEAESVFGETVLGFAGDHDMRVGDQPVAEAAVGFAVGVEDDAALAGVGIEKGGARFGVDGVGAGERSAAAREVAVRRLDFDHVGAEVAEQLGGEGRGQSLGDVDDAQSGESGSHVARLLGVQSGVRGKASASVGRAPWGATRLEWLC